MMSTDKLLHILCTWLIMLIFAPITGAGWAAAIAILAALAKEAWDISIQKDNTWKQAAQDMLADAIGLAAAGITILLWGL